MTRIYNEDCFETMKRMSDNSVSLILTSPPYNTGRVSSNDKWRNQYQGKYDVHIDNMTQEQYIDWTVNLFTQFERILVENGVVLYNMSYGTDSTMNTESIGLMWLVVADIIRRTDFTVADRIIWKKKSALPNNTSKNKLTRIVEDIFVFVRKKEIKTFTANKEVKSVRKDRSSQVYYENVFNFIEAKNNDGTCPYNKATFSSELCEKLLKIYAVPNATVYDPLIGSGTTAVACQNMGLNCIGSEISKNQVDFAFDRIAKNRERLKDQSNTAEYLYRMNDPVCCGCKNRADCENTHKFLMVECSSKTNF